MPLANLIDSENWLAFLIWRTMRCIVAISQIKQTAIHVTLNPIAVPVMAPPVAAPLFASAHGVFSSFTLVLA